MLKNSLVALICCAIVIPSSLPASETDPVIQTIDKALAEYQSQNYTNAASSLDYASQLIRQKKGKALSILLPEPFPGWTADEGKAEVTTAALLGGGMTAERSYMRGNSTVKISILTDSPLLQPMIMMVSNPLFATAAGQFELINNHKGIVSHQNNNGTINIVINNRFLITLDGKDVSRDELMQYAKAIDLESIATLP